MMRITMIVLPCVVLLSAVPGAAAQFPFGNLDFEDVTIDPNNPWIPYSTSALLPRWAVELDGVNQSTVRFGGFNIGAASAFNVQTDRFATPTDPWANGVEPPLDGHYSVMLMEGTMHQTFDVSMYQMGTVPVNARRLRFLAAVFGEPAFSPPEEAPYQYLWDLLEVSLDGTPLQYVPVGDGPVNWYGDTWYEADVSAFAGTTTQLRFDMDVTGLEYVTAYVDNISFVIPAPVAWLGGVVLLGGLMVRRR